MADLTHLDADGGAHMVDVSAKADTAREAVAAFSAFLFERFNPPALTAGVFTDNPASANVLASCGYMLVREELHPSRGRLAPAPSWVYRLANPKQADRT